MNDDTKTIFRIAKNRENPFAMIDRRALENPALSWKAKGLLGYLLSRPDNWEVQMSDLVKRATDGEFSTRGAVDELMKAGHLRRVEIRDDESGRFVRFEYEVHEQPVPAEQRTAKKPLPNNQEVDEQGQANEPFRGNPQVGNPQVDNPKVGNLPLNNTESNDTELNNTLGADAPSAPAAQEKQTNPPPAFGIEWQLAAGVSQVTLPTPEEEISAQLQNAVNLFPAAYQERARAFIQAANIMPIKSDVSGWCKAFKDHEARDLTLREMTRAIETMIGQGLTVSSPFSVTEVAKSIHAQNIRKAQQLPAAPTELERALTTFKPRQPAPRATA